MKKMLIGILLLAGTAQAQEVTVLGVADGDTILVYDGKVREVDITGIDAPEMGQPYGAEAALYLKSILPETVYLHNERAVTGGRRSADVMIPGGRYVAWDLIEEGAAWCGNRFSRNNPIDAPLNDPLCREEKKARSEGRGLWANNAAPPWNWSETHSRPQALFEYQKTEQKSKYGNTETEGKRVYRPDPALRQRIQQRQMQQKLEEIRMHQILNN